MKPRISCPSEESWQKFLLTSGMEKRQELRQHLAMCGYCRFLVVQLKSQFEELEHVWNSTSAGVIYFTPLITVEESEEPATTVLAAKGNGKIDEEAAVTLSSPDQKLLLRTVRDPHSRDIWLYLVSDDPTICRNVLVKPFAGEEELLTDDTGRINLGDIEWPKPEDLTAEVRLPKATFTLSLIKDIADSGHSAIIDSPGGDRIKVSFTGEGRNRRLTVKVLEIADAAKEAPLKMAIRIADSSSAPRIQSIALEDASFDDVGTEGTLEIYIYQ